MPKPVLLTVDDDPEVLRAIERDLRTRYSQQYRIMRADSGSAALSTLKELKARNNPVALLLADQRMPTMDGVGFLAEAMDLHPEAKRALLTAYADTNAAIDAINEARIHYYLMKPWDPPEEKLFPALDDLLSDWKAQFRPPYEGIRVLGTRWSSRSYELRDFLARNQVPYQWIDVEVAESDADVRRLVESLGPEAETLPLILFPDGQRIPEPSFPMIADKIGLRTHAQTKFYDLAIIGGGPAGLAAAVYGASEGLRTVMVEREAPGGQAGMSSRIENYLGFPTGLSGSDLARRATDQARRLGAELLTVQDAAALRVEGAGRLVELTGGGMLSANCVLVASGVSYRQMDAPGFSDFTGAGVYYGAAMTEARSCADQHVVVIGGANSAGQAAVYFAGYAQRVTMLVRSTLQKSMSHYLIEQIAALSNVDVRTGATATAAEGENGRLQRLRVRDGDGAESDLDADACFVFIGASPRTDWLDGVVARDARGFILAGPDARDAGWPLKRDPYLLETSVPGIFVAGDVRARSIKRVASAVGEGSMAVSLIH